MFVLLSPTCIDRGGSSHPCPYCEVKITIDTPLKRQLLVAKPRTCATNRKHFKKLSKMNKPVAAKHANCTSDPLRLFPQTNEIISYVRFPELHVFLHSNWYIDHMERRHAEVKQWYNIFYAVSAAVCKSLEIVNDCLKQFVTILQTW